MIKKRVSVILPANAMKEIRERMLKEGYSLREKSKWITESIETFLQMKEYHILVEIADLVSDLDKLETFYISPQLEEQLEEALIEVRKKYPSLEGVKSLIVRASIIRRLVLLVKQK